LGLLVVNRKLKRQDLRSMRLSPSNKVSDYVIIEVFELLIGDFNYSAYEDSQWLSGIRKMPLS
jgi:hypothetical protein